MSKLDEFLKTAAAIPDLKKERATARYTELRGRRGAELKLWEDWKENGKKQKDLEPLLKSFEPMIESETKKRLTGLGGSIPHSALKAELRSSVVKSLDNYDPSKAQLTTHVVGGFKRVTDFVAAGRNQLRMPRPDVEQHSAFTSARDQFTEQHGRDPTPHELEPMLPQLGDTKKKRVARIQRMMKGFSPEAHSEMGTEFDESTPMADVRDTLMLIKPQLNAAQKQFAELHYPPPGTKQKSVEAIAKELKMPSHRIYQIKGEVERRVAKILNKE